MKSFLKLCLCLGVLFFATPAFSQVPDPTGTDYCTCLEGIQSIHDECPCVDTGGNTGDNGNTDPPPGVPPTEGGSNTGGGTAEGNFPLVIDWLICFFDPDC